jgi:SAM-dependent methyltransferase
MSILSPRALPEELRPLADFLSRSDRALIDRYGTRFCGYMRGYGNPITFLVNQAESFAEAGAADATVLDLGCGFGLISCTFALLGAKRVIGVDLDSTMIGIGKTLVDELLPSHVASRIELQRRDILSDPFEPRSFELILAIESLSDIQSLEDAIKTMRRLTRAGGRILVSDGNNSYYVPGRFRRRSIWRDRESTQYRALREKLITDAFPQLNVVQIADFVEKTIGHSAEDVVGLVRYALETGVDPKPLYARVMMNPMTRYHEERELDPIAMMNMFRSEGYYATLLQPHTSYPPDPLNPKRLFKTGLRALYPLTLPAFPGFRLLMTDIRGVSAL